MEDTCPHLACLESTGKPGEKSWTLQLHNRLCIYYPGPRHEDQAAGVYTVYLSLFL